MTNPPSNFRLQGTDGIRSEARPGSSKDLAGLTPQQAFMDRGVITEDFMEIYAFAHVDQMIAEKNMKPGEAVVVGWDPRDVRGIFANAVIRGARKAGAEVIVLGVVPTPLTAMYMLYKEAKGGFMITASHNPKDQNGIKIFSSFQGMKLLPQNDVKLTQAVLASDYRALSKKTMKGGRTARRADALKLFARFSLDPKNSWIEGESFRDIALVVDPANGSLTGIAADIFRQAGFGEVIEVNRELNGDVNLYSGVADLEGHKIITPRMVQDGMFSKHAAILKLFELGAKYKRSLLNGKRRVAGAVFDADGDRYYHLEYDPFSEALIVLSGDETAYLQGRDLLARFPDRFKNTLYLNTVESDLNAAFEAKKLGFKPQLAPVGDKWILRRIVCKIIECRLSALARPLNARPQGTTVLKQKKSIDRLKRELKQIQNSGALDVERLQEIDAAAGQLEAAAAQGNPGPGPELETAWGGRIPFAVGSEETGHNITLGWLERKQGGRLPVFCGNGVKSALNTFAALQRLLRGKPPRACFSFLEQPFKPGFKAAYYAYYVNKPLFFKNSPVWQKTRRQIFAAARERGFRSQTIKFAEDPDMLYISLTEDSPADKTNGAQRASAIFIRNSGTENKISVNLRGERGKRAKLKTLGEDAIRFLFATLKDKNNSFYKNEMALALQLKGKPLKERQIVLDKAIRTRLLAEMQKQGLIQPAAEGYRLTARGKWYLKNCGHEKH
ncbi:MAG: hypothetical protein ACE5GQ_00405 [Nitrospinales bacterium]